MAEGQLEGSEPDASFLVDARHNSAFGLWEREAADRQTERGRSLPQKLTR